MIFNTEISTAFLIFGLFVPRLTLFICMLGGNIPLNNVPFWGDFFLTLLVPRFLIAYYIYLNMGNCGWMWAYIVVGFMFLSEEHKCCKTKRFS